VDALSEVLRLARFSASVTLDATAQESWCVSVPASEGLGRAHLVAEGECRLRSAQGEIALGPGDFVLLPGGIAHLIGSPVEAEATPFASLVRKSVAGELLPVRVGGRGKATRWISFSFECEPHLAQPLLAVLPPVLHVDLVGAPPLQWLRDELGLVLSASDAPFLGAGATRSLLAQLLIVEALARFVQALPPGGKGWLAGLNDRYVGRALALVHGRPSEPWTVERLGRLVGLSRSSLADRFSDVMDEPIFAFLTRWRLQLAAEFLLTTPRRIESIAHEAGYESPAAFSAAFKRTFGKPPSVWRRRRRRAA
jgi:AraC family transcriptional regulator, alkane utilization regulator